MLLVIKGKEITLANKVVDAVTIYKDIEDIQDFVEKMIKAEIF